MLATFYKKVFQRNKVFHIGSQKKTHILRAKSWKHAKHANNTFLAYALNIFPVFNLPENMLKRC